MLFVFFLSGFYITEYSWFTGQQEKEEVISLPTFYHFHLLHMQLDITPAMTVESSPLHIAAGLEPETFVSPAQVANH